MTIADYFARTDAERVLLLHIQRTDIDSTCYRLSDAPYATEATDTPANVLYAPIIGGQGLPELRRTLNDPFDGGASTSFGTVTLTDTLAAYTTGAGGQGMDEIVLPRGASVTALLAAPRDRFPLSDALTLAVGKIARRGGASDGQRTMEIIDASQEIGVRPIEVDPVAGPLTFGLCRNIEPFLIDASGPTYAVHDSAIEAVLAVYDDGVELTVTVDYTVNAADGTFTLTGSPVGRITADVKGAKVTGTWLESSAEIIEHLLDRAGVTGLTLALDLPTGLIGLHLRESTTLRDALDQVTRGCCGYWLIDRDGDFVAAQYPLPGAGTAVGERELMGEATWEESDRLYDPIRYRYCTNWTRYQAKPAATDAMAAFAAGDGKTGEVSALSTDAEYTYDISPLFVTLFDELADAEEIAERLSTLFSVPRKLLSLTVPYTAALDIGALLTVTMPDGTVCDGAVVTVSDVFDGSYPVQKLQVLA